MKLFKPRTTTIRHYTLRFITVDGKQHTYSGMSYVDPAQLLCSPVEYYLIDCKFLYDDDGIIYPISNIISISAEHDDTIENVIQQGKATFPSVWYPNYEVIES